MSVDPTEVSDEQPDTPAPANNSAAASPSLQLPTGGEVTHAELLGYWMDSCITQISQFVATARDIAASTRSGIYSQNRDMELAKLHADLTKKQRRAIEQFANKALDSMFQTLDRKVQEVGEWLQSGAGAQLGLQKDDGKIAYPLPTEQLILSLRLMIKSGGIPDAMEAELASVANSPAAARYLLEYFQRKHQETPTEVMLSALLPSLVAKLEEFLIALVRLALFVHPRAMDLQASQFQISDLEKYKVPEVSLRLAAIDKKSRSALGGDPDQWRKQLIQWPGIDMSKSVDNWDALVENILRRHAIIHNASRVDEKYLAKLPRSLGKPDLGSQLSVTAEYFDSALSRIECLVAVLSLRWPEKISPSADVNPFFAHYVYTNAMHREEWAVVELVTRALAEHPTYDDRDRVNNWLARIKLADDASKTEILREIFTWRPPPNDYKLTLARLLLLEQNDQACELLERHSVFSKDDRASIAKWPLAKQLMERNPRAGRILAPQNQNHTHATGGRESRRRGRPR